MEQLERLLAKVDMPAGCWNWIGARNRTGYGRLRTGTRASSRVEMAHRLMWEAIHGPIGDSLSVLHHCDNTRCVRPDHLYLGTPADNARDREVRGRSRAKLTADDVRLARSAYASGWTNARLARRFGVDQTTMHAIVKGRAWKHVT